MIRVEGLSKRFRLYRRPADRLKELALRRTIHSVHQALDDVSFEVAPGETLGIVGHNGAGKTTLLKLLSGVLLPDQGRIESSGRITGLLELGTGFNFELSGRQNIVNNGLLIGMSAAEVAERAPEIVAFSELGDFIEEPLKTYSSGMVMRLAFAIAIHARPETFLVDEALAVGDAHFQQKCYRRIRDFRAEGGSILFVSHDLNAVKLLCDRALLLHHGRIEALGDPEAIVNRYNALVAGQGDEGLHFSATPDGRTDYGNHRADILCVELQGRDSGCEVLASGERARCRIRYRIREPLPALTVGLLIRDRFGQDIFGTNSYHLGRPLPLEPGEWQVDFDFDMDIAPGKYSLTVALHSEHNHLEDCYHWKDAAAHFEVAGIRGALFSGVCRLRVQLSHQSLSP